MFFELGNSKKGIITSISFDISKLDKSVCDHLCESLGKKVKIIDGRVTIKTNMTLDDLKTLNDGYNEFHSRFILNNVVNFNKQGKDKGVKDKGVTIPEQKSMDDYDEQKLVD
jgi:hypothetical protein